MVVPLLAVAAARNPEWSVDMFVSRQMARYSATILGAGLYLLVMAGTGYYIREFGGRWGTTLQVTFLFGAGVLLAVLLSSGQMQARLKVFFGKHFYHSKYDYREEWLRFTRTLSVGEPNESPCTERITLHARHPRHRPNRVRYRWVAMDPVRAGILCVPGKLECWQAQRAAGIR